MIMDSLLQFSDSQVITVTDASTNSLDLHSMTGVGEPLMIHIGVEEALTDVGRFITVSLESADEPTFAAPGSNVIGVIPALSAVGFKLQAHFPILQVPKRYFRLMYTVNTAPLATGIINAQLVKDIDAFIAYPDAITIS